MNVFLAYEHRPLCFRDPSDLLCCRDPARLPACFRQLERWLDQGYYAAGFLSYEAGYFFEKRLRQNSSREFPLLCLGAYRRPGTEGFPPRAAGSYGLRDFRVNVPYPRYARHIERIRRYISRGDVYQITYCLKNAFRFRGDPRRLFLDLYRYQRVPYPAFIEAEDFCILSLSPERFIRKRGEAALAEPMKGTWPRGRNRAEDRRRRRRFSRDPKNRAENVMIADLLRNDLGRIGRDIRAPRLFTVAPYRTLFQMTSTVTGRVPGNVGMFELFAALFPSGSVTGAPKIRAMEIIREIEPEERRIHTGAIGYITPGRDLYFNVPIRTLLLRGGDGEMGVGGGIVWDSTARGEWEEGRLKSRFLLEIARAGGCRA